MLIREHSIEKYWLQKRIELLEILDSFATDAFYSDDFTVDKTNTKMIMLKKHYKEVLNPHDLNQTLKKIYPKHLYGGDQQ